VSEPKELVLLSRGCQQIAEATTIDEVKDIEDVARRFQMYAKQEGLGLEAHNAGAEVVLRAQRRQGEMLRDNLPHGGGRPPEKPGHDVRVLPRLADLGIAEKHSQRLQTIAGVKAKAFEQYISETKAAGQELTATGVYRLAQDQENEQRRHAPITLPAKGKYACLVIDPPWPVQKIEREVRPRQASFDYPTMSADELRALLVPRRADTNAQLYCWTTHKFLPLAFQLVESWGFRYECLLTWVKNVGFTPFSWMYSTEHVLFARRGNLPLLRKGLRLDFHAKVREHSRKPDEFYDLVREASPGPRLDWFSREAREGFDQCGNEPGRFGKEA
jgi:N6-adenosine-specific RNA methylase IME4